MVLECFLRWLFISVVIMNVSKGSASLSSLETAPNQNVDLDIPSRYSGKLMDDDNKDSEEDEVASIPKLNFDKRMKEVKSASNLKTGISWWPWHDGMAPVRRSFFVPRLGKRLNEMLGQGFPSGFGDPADDDAEADSEWGLPFAPGTPVPVTPAEEEYFHNGLMKEGETDGFEELKHLFRGELFSDGDEGGFSLEEDNPSPRAHGRTPRAPYSFVPRLGKREFAFAPRLGKRTFSFAPRLGKRVHSFAPRLGKKAYSFSPRLGKKAYSFSPRLGK